MSVKLSPFGQDTQLSNNGLLLAGGKLYWYLAGTTTPATVYQDSAGAVAHTNPIILNSRGEPPAPIWLTTGSAYKCILKDSLDNTIRQIDNISGINDTTTAQASEWVLFGAASYIGASSFSVSGDQTAVFTTNRRLKATVSGGAYYGRVLTATFGAGITTITTSNDSISLDSGLASMSYGLLDPIHPSLYVPNQALSVMQFSTGSSTVADGLTRYFGGAYVSSAESDVSFQIPTACTITKLYAKCPGATAGTRAYTVRKNGADTTITASSTGAGNTASDTAHTVSCVAGDTISIKLVTSGGSDVVTHTAVIQLSTTIPS